MDGAQGLKRLREGLAVDAVVTDVQMPNMTGFELTKAIKTRREAQDDPGRHRHVARARRGEGDRHRGRRRRLHHEVGLQPGHAARDRRAPHPLADGRRSVDGPTHPRRRSSTTRSSRARCSRRSSAPIPGSRSSGTARDGAGRRRDGRVAQARPRHDGHPHAAGWTASRPPSASWRSTRRRSSSCRRPCTARASAARSTRCPPGALEVVKKPEPRRLGGPRAHRPRASSAG